MAAPRFYVCTAPETLDNALASGTEVILPEKAAHHAGRALRLRNGEEVCLFAGNGREWFGTIRFDAKAAYVALTRAADPLRESPVRMTLVQALVAPDKLDWIVEKAVECGIAEIVLVPAARSVTRLAGDRLEKRVQKCTDIAVSAAEQCGRNTVPVIRAAGYEEALSSIIADARLMLAPGAVTPAGFAGTEKSVAFAVGPEGGFSDTEIETAAGLGWSPVLLGPRVLRTETAGLAAAVWVNTLLGDYPGR